MVRSCMPGTFMMENGSPSKLQPAVDLVGEHHDVAIADGASYLLNVCARQDAAVGFCGELRIMSLVRSVIRAVSSRTSIAKSRSSCNWMGTALAADVVDHRLVDGKSGIGIDDFVAFIDEGQHGEKHDGLAAGDDDDLIGRNFDLAGAADVLRNFIAKLGQPGGGAVVGAALRSTSTAASTTLPGVSKSGSPDFEMDDALTLPLQRLALLRNFKSVSVPSRDMRRAKSNSCCAVPAIMTHAPLMRSEAVS